MKAFFDVTDPVRGVSCSLSEAKKRELTIVTVPMRGVSCSCLDVPWKIPRELQSP